uniref:G protein-coupled receptor n=1 Tax=Heterorhabditis bacteriophora TaxID=37862 RepID=A0A1I7X131_HETBA
MTVLILFSECTFFIVHPTLSPAAIIINYAAQRFHYKYTQFVAVGIICYLCACAYFTVFRLQIYRYYHLDPNQHTDENSLLFSAILLCRLTPPICLNFLGMIHLDSHVVQVKDFGVETQFTKLMGHLDIISLVAKGINIYLPICILIFCAVTYYKNFITVYWLCFSLSCQPPERV